MHKDSITATIKDDAGNPVRVQKVETSEEGVYCLFRRMKNIKAVFEASRSWTYYASLLRPYCKELVMAHPLKVRAIASARIKNDKIDSNVLCDLLRAELIPKSYMPPQQIIELRETLRYRVSLGRLRAKVKNKVHNITYRHQEAYSRSGWYWL
jgi:transposase